MGPHISIQGEVIARIAGFPITNSLLTTWIVLGVSCILAWYYFSQSTRKIKSLGYYALHSVLSFLHQLFGSVLHEKTGVFFSLLGAFFLFIVLNNWSGLVPGVGSILVPPAHQKIQNEIVVNEQAAPAEKAKEEHKVPLLRGGTADLNTTIALAFISVFATQIFGFQYLGFRAHVGKYFNFRNPVLLFVGILELILEFARILSFSFRLFGNIFAGEVLLTVVPFLLPVFLSFISAPMFFMEIFVGVVQALVFTMLSAVFIHLAVSSHHD